VRRDLCDMLRDSRLVDLDNRVTLYLTAVVSLCEYTVSNKGGLPFHYLGDCGGLYFVGTTAPTAFPPSSAAYGTDRDREHARFAYVSSGCDHVVTRRTFDFASNIVAPQKSGQPMTLPAPPVPTPMEATQEFIMS